MNRCPRPEATRALSAQNGRPPNVRRESWALVGAGATVTRSAMGRRDFTVITVIRASNAPRLRGYAWKGRTYRAARSVVHNIGPPTCLGDAVKETNCSRREFLGMSVAAAGASLAAHSMVRSEEHTSELQSLAYLVCRLLLEKKKNKQERQLACALL